MYFKSNITLCGFKSCGQRTAISWFDPLFRSEWEWACRQVTKIRIFGSPEGQTVLEGLEVVRDMRNESFTEMS